MEGRATHSFNGGFEFEQLPLLRRRGRQRENNYKYSVRAVYAQLVHTSFIEIHILLPFIEHLIHYSLFIIIIIIIFVINY